MKKVHTFTRSALRPILIVAMSVSLFECCPLPMRVFLSLSLALRSHDHFPGLSLVNPLNPPPPPPKEVFLIDIVDCPRVLFWIFPCGALKKRRYSGLDAWIVPAFCSGSAPHRALKTRRCSGLDAWIVPAFWSGLSQHGALKTGRFSELDAWIVPAFFSRSSPHRALKRGRCSESNLNVLFSF